MILLDKAIGDNELIFSISGLLSSSASPITVNFFSTYTHKEYSSSFTDSTSLYPERYLSYNLTSSLFQNWDEGLYTYNIYPSGSIVSVENGIARVINSAEILPQTISIDRGEASDNMIIYNKD